jgi:uncharacterized repeat protein (TIGR01451 family)
MVQGRRWSLVLLAAGLAWAAGCESAGQSEYFSFLAPPGGGLVQTSSRVPGPANDVDPHAVKVEVLPAEATNAVRAQHVLVATVTDEKGQPRAHRRIEWMLEGVGNIIEVDENGGAQDRGQKHDNHYAVSYTGDTVRRVSRNNGNPADDIVLNPGQTWCVVSAAVEGDSHVTVYAPEVANWDNHRVLVTTHWVDADWVFPRPAVNRAGTQHVLTTGVFKHTDRQPLTNYRVRYKILDGPPAVFAAGQKQEAEAASDTGGNAGVTLVQVAPTIGTNRIGIEILRPPDRPSGACIVIGKGETTVAWQAPQVALTLNVPPTAPVGQESPSTITVSNTGTMASQFLTVHDVIPQSFRYLRSDPQATLQGNELIWPVGELAPGQSRVLQVVFEGTQPGKVGNTVALVGRDGVKDEKRAETEVVMAGLKANMTGPAEAAANAPVSYDITVTNTGTGPATNVVLRDSFDPGLEHESKANPVELPLGTLAPGATRTVRITLTPRRGGTLTNQVAAGADGVPPVTARHIIQVQEAKLVLKQTGPRARYAGRPVTWKLTVSNPSSVPVANVTVRDQIPAEVVFQGASDNGQFANGQVTWNLGALQPKERRTVTVSCQCGKLTPRAVNRAVASADPGATAQDESALEIRGLPAFCFRVSNEQGPVELNEKTTYKMEVINQGSLPGSQVRVTAFVPAEMRVVATNGPTSGKQDGQQVTFVPVDGPAPGETLTYTVAVQALRAGEVHFRAELRAATLSSPVVQEVCTTIFTVPAGGDSPPASPTPPPVPVPAGTAPALPPSTVPKPGF